MEKSNIFLQDVLSGNFPIRKTYILQAKNNEKGAWQVAEKLTLAQLFMRKPQ